MSANELIEKFEAERAEIQGKLADLETREVFLGKLITEIQGKAPAKRAPAAGRRTGGKRGPSKKGMTANAAIVKIVSEAGKPLSPAEIVPGAMKLSGGAEASIRSRLNNLSKSGVLEQIAHEGRGFKYAVPSGATGAPVPARKKRGRKSASKKKAGSSKAGAGTSAEPASEGTAPSAG